MRPILAILIACVLLGGTYAYTHFAASVRHRPSVYETNFADDIYSVEIRRTYPAAPLSSDSNPGPSLDSKTRVTATEFPTNTSTLKLVFKGSPLIDRRDEIPASEAVEISNLNGVEIGLNELFVSSNRAPSHSEFAALNLQVKKNDLTISDSTFTSDPRSTLIYGVVVFEARPAEPKIHTH